MKVSTVNRMMNVMREVYRCQVNESFPPSILEGMWRKSFAKLDAPYDGSLRRRRYWKKVTERIKTAHAAGAVLADGCGEIEWRQTSEELRDLLCESVANLARTNWAKHVVGREEAILAALAVLHEAAGED